LAIDTSTPMATVALLHGAEVLAEGERRVTTHSERLLVTIDEVLRAGGVALATVDAIACGRGPGSFTGLRIGLATAKALAWSASKPLVCPSSLAALVGNLADRRPRPPLTVPCIDARRGEVFAGFFGAGGEIEPEAVLEPQALAQKIRGRDAVILGDGAAAYRHVFKGIELAADDRHAVRAREVGRLALARLKRGDVEDTGAVEPTYLRASDAETGRKRR
jgi:tRNA threonylcarbamoyladenosine biosynthesis protein TsaB